MAIGFMKRISPEYVLKNAIKDIKEMGFDGLKPYLTVEGYRKAENLLSLTGGIDMFTAMAFMFQPNAGRCPASLKGSLNDTMKECDYTVKDLLKGSSSAKAIVAFEHKDGTKGTIELTMIKENKEWKIDDMDMPKLEKRVTA